MNRIDRHNVGVLHLRENKRFITCRRSDFKSDVAVRKIALFGEVDSPKRAASQFADKLEVNESLADSRHFATNIGALRIHVQACCRYFRRVIEIGAQVGRH